MKTQLPIDVLNHETHPISPQIIKILKDENITSLDDIDNKPVVSLRGVFKGHIRWYNTFCAHLYKLGLVSSTEIIHISKFSHDGFLWNATLEKYK